MFNNPKRIISLSLLISTAALIFYACAHKKPTSIPTDAKVKLTLEDFSFLKAGISFDEVVAQVGNPDGNIGSGIHIFVYKLQDGSEVHISFIYLDNLNNASLLLPDGTGKVLVLPEKMQTQTP